jgi:hypothetical protein
MWSWKGERNDNRRVGAKRKPWGRGERHFLRVTSIILLEGSHALPVHLSDKGRMKLRSRSLIHTAEL